MIWINVRDKSNPLKENYPYLIYGYMWGHFPQNDIAIFKNGTWYSYDDEEHYFREDEVDFYMDIMKFDPPKYQKE